MPSKKTDERSTPDILFNSLHKEFNFQIDLAASNENHKLPIFCTKENSAFNFPWNGRCFLNPPYSEIYKWLQYASKQIGLLVVILPCDTSTRWFHDFIWDCTIHASRPGIQLRFPKGRYKFGNYVTSPKFATIIAVMRHE